ncbi:MAG: GntR family transcriptional regulator [Chloroflexota bacterium]
MEMERIDTQRAYEYIWQKITTLELAPGSALNEQQLAEELDMGLVPVREALKLLIHDGLVVITPRHGPYVADLNIPELEQLSEMRLSLESLCARLAARRATPDDLAVLDALRQEAVDLYRQVATSPQNGSSDLAEVGRRLFDVDHKFHQAIARAAHNKYMTRTLDQFFGLSQRLWYLALPYLDFLPAAVEEHLELVAAIKAGDADRAEQIMRNHVQGFYNKVQEILAGQK